MAIYSSRKDQLWYLALQLAEEETKSIQFAQENEEHGKRIRTKYNQLVSNLSCLGDIIAIMYQEEKLSLKEFEHIQSMQSTPIRANEEMLSIIARKPRDVYECFLSLIKSTNQLHLYKMLASGDDTCHCANEESISDHKDLICRNFMWLSENLDTESGLISLLYQLDVLTLRERERIFSANDTFQKNELLLGLISKKSVRDFHNFLKALQESGQGYLIQKLRKPADSPANPTESSAVQAPTNIYTELLPKVLRESMQKSDVLPSSSKPVIPPKTLPQPGQKRIPSCLLWKPDPTPKPDTQSIAIQPDVKSICIADKNTENKFQNRRTKRASLQTRLEGLEPRLKTELAIKVTSVSLLCMDKRDDSLRMSSQILLQDFHRMKKENVARNVEVNVELEQLRENASQYSAVSSLNEMYRSKLHAMEQESIIERCHSNEERIKLEEKINKLKADIHNENAKCSRLEEEKLLSKTVIMKMEERLRKSDCNNQFFQHQIQELNTRITTREHELQIFKVTFEECNREMTLLRTDKDKLKGVSEMLTKEKEIRNELEIQLKLTEEYNRDLLGRLKKSEESLDVSEKEMLELIETQKSTMEERAFENDLIMRLQEELEISKHQRTELEDKLTFATTQLEQLECKADGICMMAPTMRENHVIMNNYQFLVENLESGYFIDLLHEKKCITDEERDYLSSQPNNFCRNDAILHWMRNIKFTEDKGLKVLKYLRKSQQNFVVDLLSKGGVLIKSKISTKLVKERKLFSPFAKSISVNVEALNEKEAMLIEELNQRRGIPLPGNQNVRPDSADDEIIITPYCHQESNGIIFWFWCQSKNARINLFIMYSTDILLEKVETIFKTFSNVNATSESELLVPTGITIYMDDFKRNEKVVDFEMEPKLLVITRTKAAERPSSQIFAIAVLSYEVFVISKKNSEVEVYSRTSLQFQRSFTVDGLKEPRDIVSCSRNNCLYIIDGKPLGHPMEILRVDIKGNILKKVWRGNDWGRLSVTDESHLILTVFDKSKLFEITPDGQLVREITLAIENPWHAVKLTSGLFVVTYGRCSGGGICLVDNIETVLTSQVPEALEIGVFLPINVAVNKDGSFLVVDESGGRILLLTLTLEFQREFISRKHGLDKPRRIFVDEPNGRLLVCDNSNGGRIMAFDIAD